MPEVLKYYLGLTTITQDVDDFLTSEYGKVIVTNSSLQLLLKCCGGLFATCGEGFGGPGLDCCNGFRLSEKKFKMKSDADDFEVILPAKTLAEVARLFSTSDVPVKFILKLKATSKPSPST